MDTIHVIVDSPLPTDPPHSFSELFAVVNDSGFITQIGVLGDVQINNKQASVGLDLVTLEGASFDLNVSSFQTQVLEAVRRILPGETRTYKQVAETIRRPQAWRAVGTALATNPLPFVYPCHRVVASNGNLGKYIFGNTAKQFLLSLDREPTVR